MGIDLLDIAFRIEKKFGLRLESDYFKYALVPPLDDAGFIVPGADIPVRKLLELICQRVAATQTGFEKLVRRRQEVCQALHECFGVDLNSITPDNHLEDLIPKTNRRKHWSQLGKTLDRKLPGLVRPEAARWLLMASATGVTFFVVTATRARPDSKHILTSAFELSFCSAAFWLFVPRDRIPPTCRTVEHLIRFTESDEAVLIASKNAETARKSLPPPHVWTDEAVYLALRKILADALDVDEKDITLDSKLFRDLGCE